MPTFGEIERRASEHFAQAVDMVVDSVTSFLTRRPKVGQTAIAPAIARDGRILAQVLRGELAASGRALARFLPHGSGELVAWYNQRFEIENLKTVLRTVHYGLDRSRARASLISLRSTRWRWEALIEAESIAAVVDQIRESPHARPLEHAMERYRQEQRLFYLEAALDLSYFQKLVRLIEAQTGREGADARRFLGRWIAVQNLVERLSRGSTDPGSHRE